MAKEKKPHVDDIEKLRKILDNPYDPNAAKLISSSDTTIDSVRKRLTHKPLVFRTAPSASVSRVSFSLQPTVTIRPRTRTIPLSSTVSTLPVFEPVPTTKSTSPSAPVAPLPEFEPVPTASIAETQVIPEEPLFDNEDLIEIETVDTTYPEFSAVQPTDEPELRDGITSQPQEGTPSETQAETYQGLPLWRPVTETSSYEPTITHERPSAEEIPEFTRLSSETAKEAIEKPTALEPVITEKQPLSKQQRRAEKKLEQQKQKEAKQQLKMERKQARREARQKEQEAVHLASEQAQVNQPPETPLEEPAPVVEQPRTIKVDLSAFIDIESIDEHVGELLYRSGYFSVDDLRKATIDDLVSIRGIKRKLAKKIKKEVEQKPIPKPDEEFIIYNKKASPKKPKTAHKDITEWESFSVGNHEDVFAPIPATYGKYTLYKRQRGKGATKTTIHFFSKEKPAFGTPAPLPEGYKIALNKKTKVPYLKKKK